MGRLYSRCGEGIIDNEKIYFSAAGSCNPTGQGIAADKPQLEMPSGVLQFHDEHLAAKSD